LEIRLWVCKKDISVALEGQQGPDIILSRIGKKLILVLPSFLQSNSKLKQFLANLSVWVIIVLIVTTISYFLFK
jgi:hypothetical protein